jgi:AcrR family transcriptional regulator
VTSEGAASRTGRPRDTSIDERALEAARHLLVEEGFEATTIQAVATRAGLHTSAIYRRWSTPVELVQDAAFADLAPGRVRPTGDLRRDLRRFLRAYVTTFDSPVVRAAMPGLVSAARKDGAVRSREAWLRVSVRPQFRELLAAAPPGEVDPAVDPDDVFELLLGTVLVRAIVPMEVRRRPPLDRTVDLVLRAIRPGPTGSAPHR